MGIEPTINKTDRIIYFDYLRVAAIFAIIMVHVSAQNWNVVDVNSLKWQVFNGYEGLLRWGSSNFVMISGALFLSRNISLDKIFSKYVLRLVIAFLIWSLIYSLFEKGTVVDKIVLIVQGHYHMWFILMIIGLYICLPIIRLITQNSDRIRYFLLLWFVFAFVIPEVVLLVGNFGSETVKQIVNAANKSVAFMKMNLVIGYAGYFILGYYLNQITLDRKLRIIVYVLGLFGFLSTVCLSSIVSLKTQSYSSQYYDPFTVNVLFEVIAVYTWFKYRDYKHSRLNRFFQKLSKYSFGAFLIHPLIIEQLDKHLGLNTLSFNPVFSVICIGVSVFIASFFISALLNQIPVVKKYLV